MGTDDDGADDDGAPERSANVAWILVGRAEVRGHLQPVEIAIDDEGIITALGRDLRGGPRHDVGESVILPAATDLHVHLREPGGPRDVETLASGTVQAALGGVGLVGDMPNTIPPVTDSDGVEEKARGVSGRAAVDVLLYALPVRLRALARLAETAGGFKVYLSPTTGVEEVPAASEVAGLLARLAELGLPVSVHAEDPSRFRTDLPDRGLVDWNARRPVAAELAALGPLVDAPPSVRLHVAHVTTGTVADRLRAAGVSFEATPHHLLLSERSGDSSYRKVNPPLRSEADRAALWARFRRGEVPCLASDHAPHSLDAKARPFDLAPSGMPGVETMLPLMLARVRASELALGTLVAAASDRPSRWVGQPRGRLAVGHQADLLVVDFRARTRLEARRLHAPCGWTAFEGWEAIFPREHYLRGERIVEDGQYVGRPAGEVVRPEYARSRPPARTRTGGRT